MKLIALVTEPKSVTRFLRHLGEPTDAPAISAARDPPYFTSRAVRRALAGGDGVAEWRKLAAGAKRWAPG